jgi:stage III sporulation protein AE
MILLSLLTLSANASDFTAPPAPEDALELMPKDSVSFGQDLLYVLTQALRELQPTLAEGAMVCSGVFAAALLLGIFKSIPGKGIVVTDLVGVLVISVLLLSVTGTMVPLASDTVTELSEYGKVLLPVMTAALASQGGITSSTAMYTATALFDSFLAGLIQKLLVPMVYIYLLMAVAAAATGEGMLTRVRDFIKGAVTWCLKVLLYIFTGYISITGVVSGTADAAALKATKLTMSGVVPVVGGILSDASEAVLVGAGIVKNAVGLYGMVALFALWIAPFLRIGLHYLLLKLTSALCGLFDSKAINDLVSSFCNAMGLLLAMTGTACILFLISMVCFMKGVG